MEKKMDMIITKVPAAGLTPRWRGWRRRWTSSGASWSTGSPHPSARLAPGTWKTSLFLKLNNKTAKNSVLLLSSIWKASCYSKTVHSSSESRTIIDGKEVEGSKTSYSARFLFCQCRLKIKRVRTSKFVLPWKLAIHLFGKFKHLWNVALLANEFGLHKQSKVKEAKLIKDRAVKI